MRISCLHTTPLNIPVYEAAAPEGVHLVHHVRSELLYRARQAVDDGLAAETNIHLERMAAGSDAVLLTCSLLSEVVVPPAYAAEVLLAEAVAGEAHGKSIDVFHTGPEGRPSVQARFGSFADAADVRLISLEAAQVLLHAGDRAAHDALVARAIEQSDADLIVLVQATLLTGAPDGRHVLSPAVVALTRLSRIETAAV